MTSKRLDEATIDASLDAHLHGAKEGDTSRARQFHNMLDSMLTGKEVSGGRLWLTEHGKTLLADMHRQLGHCEGSGSELRDKVLEAVDFKPHKGHWEDTCSYLGDLRVAIAVANELCEQRRSGNHPDVAQAVNAVADSGEFGLGPSGIREVYDEIASTIVGFKDISHC